MVFINFIAQFFLNKKIDFKKYIKNIIFLLIFSLIAIAGFFYIKSLKLEIKSLNTDLEVKTQLVLDRDQKIISQEKELTKEKESRIIDNKYINNKIKKDKEIDNNIKNNINNLNNEIDDIKNNKVINDIEKKKKINEVLINKIYDSYCNTIGLDINECNG